MSTYRPVQVDSASRLHSVTQYSPNMSELLGFVPTPNTGNPPAPADRAALKPSVASSYSFGVPNRPGMLSSARKDVHKTPQSNLKPLKVLNQRAVKPFVALEIGALQPGMLWTPFPRLHHLQ